MKSLLTVAVFVVALSLTTAAQGLQRINGTVSRPDGPAAGASVSLIGAVSGRPVTTTTDAGGRYSFTVKPGVYMLTASQTSDGRTFVHTARIEVVESPGSMTLDLALVDAGTIREMVNVSADEVQPVEEISKTVDVITAREMRERADFSLVESLRSLPGLRIQQLGGFGKAANIKSRGLRNQDTAVLIDGVRFRDAAAITGDASSFLPDITLTSIERIEVLRGAGSSLYGTNAIGGTVDIRTPGAADGLHGQFSGAAGKYGLGRFRGNLSYGGSRFGIGGALSHTVYTKGLDGEDDANNTNIQTRVDYSPFATTNVSGRIFFSKAAVRLNSNPDTFGTLPFDNFDVIDAEAGVNFTPDVNDPDDRQRSQFFNGHIAVTHAFTPKLTLNAIYSGLETRRTNLAGPLGVGFQGEATSKFDGGIHTANASVEWVPNDIHRVRVGYEYEHETFRNIGLTPDGSGNFSTRATQASSSIFAQELASIADGRLQLAIGGRAQFFDLGAPQFSLQNAPYSGLALDRPPTAYTFDASGSYYFRSTHTKLRAHVGTGYRVPSLYERFGTFFSTFFTPEFIALGDPGLKPERSIGGDAAIEQQLAGGRVRLAATYFYTRLIDTVGFGFVVPDIGTTPRPFGGYENQNGGISRGVEFSADLKPNASTDLFASYTFTNSDQRAPQVFGSGTIATLGVPESQFTLVATQRFKRFWVNLDLLFSDSYLAPITNSATFTTYVYRFEGNRRADVTAGYTFRLNERHNLRLFGTLENVFDDRYYENGFRTAGPNGRAGLAFSF
jgi:outer membrane receptor protein involved in Fe transport